MPSAVKVCILSDSHDHIPLLRAAMHAAREAGVGAVLHCGDVVAPSTLQAASPPDLPVHVIHGNNMGDLYAMSRVAAGSAGLVHYHGQDASLELGGRRIFLVHYPHYARAMAATGDWDLVCCGHTHRAWVEHHRNLAGGQTTVVNPGTVGGVGAHPSYVIGDLETMHFQIHDLEVPQPLPSY